jgi:hypothetical protein
MLANLELQQTTSLPCSLDWKWSLSYFDFCCCHVECSNLPIWKTQKCLWSKIMQRLENKCFNLYMLHAFKIATHGNKWPLTLKLKI